MVGNEERHETTEANRRRFLELAAKLGIAAPPVVVLALTSPKYAAASGFTPPQGTGSSSGGSSSGGSVPANRQTTIISREGKAGDGDHRR
jgi:hypothetical protein